MLTNRSLSFALVLSASSMGLLACGGGSSSDSNATTSEDSETLSAAQEMSPSSVYVAPGEESPTTAGSDDATTSDPAYPKCHPHLFARGVAYSRVLNDHLGMFLANVDSILKIGPRVR